MFKSQRGRRKFHHRWEDFRREKEAFSTLKLDKEKTKNVAEVLHKINQGEEYKGIKFVDKEINEVPKARKELVDDVIEGHRGLSEP